MLLDQEFERIVGWFARHRGEVDHGHVGLTTPEAALARAEYELQQVRRDLADVMLKPLEPERIVSGSVPLLCFATSARQPSLCEPSLGWLAEPKLAERRLVGGTGIEPVTPRV